MRIRVRGPSGSSTINTTETATIGELLSQISEKTSLQSFDIKYSYPPTPLQLDHHERSTSLSDLGVKLDGEQLIVSAKEDGATRRKIEPPNERKKPPPSRHVPPTMAPSSTAASEVPTGEASAPFSFADLGVPPPKKEKQPTPTTKSTPQSRSAAPLSLTRNTNAEMQSDPPELALPDHKATLVLRIMPDDNSCMFRAFGSAFLGSIDSMTELRSLTAQTIQAHPEIYPEVVLEQKPDDYCVWIQTEDAWGGGIELSILSKHFDIEVCSIDVQTLRVDKFNEGMSTRCILVYSGIHYDTIALSPSEPPYKNAYAPPEFDIKVFDTADQTVLDRAVELCKVLQGRHYFTDTAGFAIKCNICGGQFVGENGATEHAKQTGHYDFGEAG
ncbi:MAG: ubiquitin-specific protease otu1 [Pycnora praestabilis]|nr:MAG: ubiquitin-specific protease otu1 [Pycnora praestabilis]